MSYIKVIEVLTLFNDLVNNCTDKEEFYNRAFDAIDTMPTTDIVEVVRCKDCLYNHNGGCTHSEIYDDTNYNPEYYCADGERREE